MGIFTALRNWFGGRPSLSVVSADMSASVPDPITEPAAISMGNEAQTEEAPVTQFDYSPVLSVESPVSSLPAITEVHDVTPMTTTAPEISVPSISTTETPSNQSFPAVIEPAKSKPRSRTTRPRRSTRARKHSA